MRACLWFSCYREAFLSDSCRWLSLIFVFVVLIGHADSPKLGTRPTQSKMRHGSPARSSPPLGRRRKFWIPSTVFFSYYLAAWSTDGTIAPHASRCCVFLIWTSLTSLDAYFAFGSHTSRCGSLLVCFSFSILLCFYVFSPPWFSLEHASSTCGMLRPELVSLFELQKQHKLR